MRLVAAPNGPTVPLARCASGGDGASGGSGGIGDNGGIGSIVCSGGSNNVRELGGVNSGVAGRLATAMCDSKHFE